MGTYNGFNGIISGTVLSCGVIFSILIGVMVRKIVNVMKEDSNTDAYPASVSAPYWIIGFAYIVPGLIGIIASGIQKKGGYVIQMVFCVMALVATATCFLGAVSAVALWSLFAPKTCLELKSVLQLSVTCDDINSINGLSVGAGIMLILGWCFTFISIIIAGHHAFSQQGQLDKVDNYISNHVGHMERMPTQQAFVLQPTGYATGYAAQYGYSGVSVYKVKPAGYNNLPRYAIKPALFSSQS